MYNVARWTSSSLLKRVEEYFGVTRLYCGTAKEWDNWGSRFVIEHPYINWLYNKIDSIQEVLQYPFYKLYDILYYIRYRYIIKTHYVPTGLPPGEWYETDERLIFSMFNLLVDFIEIEKANMQRLCKSNSYSNTPWYLIYRSREQGLQYLNWEITLTGEDGRQSYTAQEQLALYNWWTEIRPNRLDPYESTGYNSHCDTRDWQLWDDVDDVLQPMLRQIREIQNDYNVEDTDMMIRLVRVRASLWT
jgi:hypothetical protein